MVDTSPKAILNIVEMVLSVIVGGLIGNLTIFSSNYLFIDVSKNQFIDAGVYGYLIISILVVAANIVGEKITKNVRLAICGIAFVVWITAGALLLEFVDKVGTTYGQEVYDRSLAAGIISLAVSISYAIDAFLVYKE